MALPKRKVSRSRAGKRGSHRRARLPGLSVCPHCRQPKLPHRACTSCGYYGGEQIVEAKKAKT